MAFDVQDDRINLRDDRDRHAFVHQVEPIGRQFERVAPDRRCIFGEIEKVHAEAILAAAARDRSIDDVIEIVPAQHILIHEGR